MSVERLENPITNNSAENESKLSLRDWQGELHAHSREDIDNPVIPEDVLENRKGSNCGRIPLEILARYHAEELRNQYLAITEHSRDADPDQAIEGMTEWFNNMYLENKEWLQGKFEKIRGELTKKELEEVRLLASEKAQEILYTDERLQRIQNDADKINQAKDTPIWLIKGVEANLQPDGTYDTDMIEQGKFELVNCSIHPHLNRKAFTEIIKDPEKYTDLVIKGIKHPKTNVMCHISNNVDAKVVEQLDWNAIARAAAENKVAIEVNLRAVIKYLYEEIFNYDKYPANETSYIAALRVKLDKLIPIISSPKIIDQIKPYFEKGLKLAINTDEHENIFIDSSTAQDGSVVTFKERGVRYWRAMKIVEKYFNQRFKELGISNEHIINTYSAKELKRFLTKE